MGINIQSYSYIRMSHLNLDILDILSLLKFQTPKTMAKIVKLILPISSFEGREKLSSKHTTEDFHRQEELAPEIIVAAHARGAGAGAVGAVAFVLGDDLQGGLVNGIHRLVDDPRTCGR